MIRIQGKGASPGIAKGPLRFVAAGNLSVEKRKIDDAPEEVAKLKRALETAGKQLETLAEDSGRRIGKENAELFRIHAMMLDDEDFTNPIIEIVKSKKLCAEYAVSEISSNLALQFASMDDEYMKARAIDLKDVSQRLVAILTDSVPPRGGRDDRPAILAADDFTPSEVAEFDAEKVLAMVSRRGAENSHTSIFARAMGIPAIVDLGDALFDGLSGMRAIADGETGLLRVESL